MKEDASLPEHARFETRAIHVGQEFRAETGAVTPPIYMTSTFESGNPGGFDYTRSGSPNFRNLQNTLASLEGAQYSTVFASGVSAITANTFAGPSTSTATRSNSVLSTPPEKPIATRPYPRSSACNFFSFSSTPEASYVRRPAVRPYRTRLSISRVLPQ